MQSIYPFDFLFFSQLNGIVRLLASPCVRRSVLAWGILPTLGWAFLSVALLALKKELLTLSAAEPTNWSGITRHIVASLPRLDASSEADSRYGATA